MEGNRVREDDEEDEENEESDPTSWCVLKIGSKVNQDLQFKAFKDQKRVDFVANGVWAIKFFSPEEYKSFVRKYQEYLFENTYGYEANDANKVKVYGKDFLGWVKPEEADDSMWEDAEKSLYKTPTKTPIKQSHDLNEEFEEAAENGRAI
ncbi:CYPRO4 [Olea europaea subsp. europaea]|uniref:CYPRO4 n=1 Tax=Olea europaea subsp. europaea TaxID=158383 RepID=A0A8S0RA54_OLEEU|nr:CYPRO4 [Olea europaea subsp. europaea]